MTRLGWSKLGLSMASYMVSKRRLTENVPTYREADDGYDKRSNHDANGKSKGGQLRPGVQRNDVAPQHARDAIEPHDREYEGWMVPILHIHSQGKCAERGDDGDYDDVDHDVRDPEWAGTDVVGVLEGSDLLNSFKRGIEGEESRVDRMHESKELVLSAQITTDERRSTYSCRKLACISVDLGVVSVRS